MEFFFLIFCWADKMKYLYYEITGIFLLVSRWVYGFFVKVQRLVFSKLLIIFEKPQSIFEECLKLS